MTVTSMVLPGGNRTRLVQAATLAFVVWAFESGEQGPDSVMVGLIVGAIYAIPAGWVAWMAFSASDAPNTLEYLTNGQAVVDTYRHARR
jgi:hypothetical protein